VPIQHLLTVLSLPLIKGASLIPEPAKFEKQLKVRMDQEAKRRAKAGASKRVKLPSDITNNLQPVASLLTLRRN
jgi:hypothetical protein